MPRLIASIFVLLLLCLSSLQSFAGETQQQAAIATAHPLATQAGFEILEQAAMLLMLLSL